MTRSKACRGRIGIAFFALGSSLAAVEVRARVGGTTASGTKSAPANIANPGFLFEREDPLKSLGTVPIINEL